MDFVFTSDIARANVLAAESDATDEVFNVASGDRDEPARARVELLRVMGSDLAVAHGPERGVNKVPRRLADTSAAREALGFEAEVGLEKGLTRLVAVVVGTPRRRALRAGRGAVAGTA